MDRYPATFILVVQGHEYSAEVVATGKAVTVCKAGDLVTARPQLVCGKCKPCLRGEYNICENLKVQAFQANGAAQDFSLWMMIGLRYCPKRCRWITEP